MIISSQNSFKFIITLVLIGVTLIQIFSPQGFSLLKIFTVCLFLLPIMMVIYFFFRNLYKFKYINNYFKVVYFSLLLWILVTIGRSINTNITDLMTLFSHYRVGGIVWLTPLFIIYGFNLYNWKTLIEYIPKLLTIGIILFFISTFIYNFQMAAVKYWLLFFVLAIFSYSYYNKLNKFIIFISVIFYAIVSINISQRANFLFLVLIFSFLLFQYIKSSYVSVYKKILLFLTISVMSIVLSFSVNDYYNQVSKNDEVSADTRTFLFLELIDDMTPTELIIGKGALGTYFSPYFYQLKKYNISDEGDAANRVTSEVGYLFMLLKGGIVMIVLHLLILLPAIYIGLFKSNNNFVKGLALYILSYTIMWSLTYTPEFLPEFILLWMAVGACISKELRKKTDSDIYQLIYQRKVK